MNKLQVECASLYKSLAARKDEINAKERSLKVALRDYQMLEEQIKELLKKNKLLAIPLTARTAVLDSTSCWNDPSGDGVAAAIEQLGEIEERSPKRSGQGHGQGMSAST